MSKEPSNLDRNAKRRLTTRFVLAVLVVVIIISVSVYLLNNDVTELFPKKPVNLPDAPA